MNNQLLEKFKYLPNEIINQIINYTDIVVYRYGKYMNRISKDDKRYKLVEKIPKPIKIGLSRFLIKLLNKNREGYFLEYVIGMYIKINIKFVSYEIDGFDRYLETKSFFQYIFDINNNWSKILYYSM
jgi:hypothetical protein